MSIEELQILIKQGEGFNLEFKQSFPSKLSELAHELCAFANASGGTLIVGIKDDGAIKGIEIDNSTRSRVQDVINSIDPRPDIMISETEIDGKLLLCFECKSGTNKPYLVSGSIYVRNGPNSQKLTSAQEIKDFYQETDSIFFDSAPSRAFNYPEDFNTSSFHNFLNKCNLTVSIDDDKILDNLKLVLPKNVLTNAAVLFFAKDVQHFVDQAIIRCVLFKGTDKRYVVDTKEITGNLLEQYEEGMKYIISKLNLRYDIEGQPGGFRKEILEIPETAFRECLVNSLCHRSYYERGAVTMIEIYDDRLEISNPGGLISAIRKEEFGHKSLSRNPLIFGLMQRVNLVEKIGSGIARMKDAMLSAGLLEPVFAMGGFFSVTFYRPIDFEKWLISIKQQLGEKRFMILRILHENPVATIKEMAEIIHTTTRTIERNIAVLKSLGLLERIGTDKIGSYKINQIKMK
jgi:ATP-dependent DNA helicase RecG